MKRFEQPIYVTRPYLPPLKSLREWCTEILANEWRSNNAPVLAFRSAPAARMLKIGFQKNVLLCEIDRVVLQTGIKWPIVSVD